MTNQAYKDDDFIYVNPDTKEIVGKVEWSKDGKPLSKERPEPEGATPAEGKKKPRKKRKLPWGSFRTMNRIHKLKGVERGEKGTEDYITLDEAIAKSNEEPFWD